jgi:hypothetical protein
MALDGSRAESSARSIDFVLGCGAAQVSKRRRGGRKWHRHVRAGNHPERVVSDAARVAAPPPK